MKTVSKRQYGKGLKSKLYKGNSSNTCYIISGTDKKVYFNQSLFNNAIKFICDKFNLHYGEARQQVICNLFNNAAHRDYRVNYNNALLKNIVELDYEWKDLIY